MRFKKHRSLKRNIKLLNIRRTATKTVLYLSQQILNLTKNQNIRINPQGQMFVFFLLLYYLMEAMQKILYFMFIKKEVQLKFIENSPKLKTEHQKKLNSSNRYVEYMKECLISEKMLLRTYVKILLIIMASSVLKNLMFLI